MKRKKVYAIQINKPQLILPGKLLKYTDFKTRPITSINTIFHYLKSSFHHLFFSGLKNKKCLEKNELFNKKKSFWVIVLQYIGLKFLNFENGAFVLIQ